MRSKSSWTRSSPSRSARSKSSTRCAASPRRTRPRSATRWRRASAASPASWRKGRPCRSMADTAVPATTLGPSAPASAAGSPAPPPQKLDELMLAMDVVDTLRHQDSLVARELDETRREAQLIERLRQIYRDQGIEVPDRVLHEGVRALKESRFVYTPPSPGLARTLALAWVHRGRTGKALLGLLVTAGIGWGAYQVGVVRPAQQRTEQARARQQRGSSATSPIFCRAPWSRAIRRFWRRRRWMKRGSEPTEFS